MNNVPSLTGVAAVMRGAACTDPGRVRSNNEDLPLIDESRGIFGVIDGVGGEAGGEVAAATAYDVVLQRLARPLGTPAERVREAIALANNEICRRAEASPELRGMACVITLALVGEGRLTIGHVGDSRLYKMRGDDLRKLTRDHSPVGEREDAGEISEADAMHHPRRNEVFRDVGSVLRDKDEADFVDVIEQPLEHDSAILICSDGLTDMLSSGAVAHIVRQYAGDPHRVASALVAAANDAGGKDNVTVVYAEGPLFARARAGNVSSSLTPTEPLPSLRRDRPSSAETVAATGRLSRAASAVVRSRTTWFVLGLLLGIAGALGLMFYVAKTQVQPTQTRVVSTDAGAAFSRIADAMALSSSGDTVLVEPGTYVEHVVVADGVNLMARLPGSVVIARPLGLPANVASLSTGGSGGVRVSGLRIEAGNPPRGAAAIQVAGAGAVFEMMEIAGGSARIFELGDGSAVTLRGSRVEVPGVLISVPDDAQASFAQNVFVRAVPSAAAPVVAAAASRLALTGNVFSGFPPAIIEGLGEPRRRELLAGNLVFPPTPPPPAPRGRRR